MPFVSFEKCPNCKGKVDFPGRQFFKMFKPFPCPHCGTMITKRIRAIILMILGFYMCAGAMFFSPNQSSIAKQIVMNGHANALILSMVAWVILSLSTFGFGGYFLMTYYDAKSDNPQGK